MGSQLQCRRQSSRRCLPRCSRCVCVCVELRSRVFFFIVLLFTSFFSFLQLLRNQERRKVIKKNRENSAAACADYCPFESIVRWLHGGDFLATLGSCVVVALKALRSESELKKKKEEKKNVCRNGATRSGRGEAAA